MRNYRAGYEQRAQRQRPQIRPQAPAPQNRLYTRSVLPATSQDGKSLSRRFWVLFFIAAAVLSLALGAMR